MLKLEGCDDRALVLEDTHLSALRWGSEEARFPLTELTAGKVVRHDKGKTLGVFGKKEERVTYRLRPACPLGVGSARTPGRSRVLRRRSEQGNSRVTTRRGGVRRLFRVLRGLSLAFSSALAGTITCLGPIWKRSVRKCAFRLPGHARDALLAEDALDQVGFGLIGGERHLDRLGEPVRPLENRHLRPSALRSGSPGRTARRDSRARR